VLARSTQGGLAFAGASLRIPNLTAELTSRNVVNALATTVIIVPVRGISAVFRWDTFASTRREVEDVAVVALTNADTAVDSGVPNLVDVAFVRQRLAGAVAVVQVFVSRRTLLERTLLCIQSVRCAGLHPFCSG